MAGTNELEVNIVQSFGADDCLPQCFSIYIPNKDRNGVEIGNQRKWVLEAIGLLSEINGGATALPPVEGGWKSDDGRIVWENPVIVYSFVDPVTFASQYARVREFIHRVGRETNQGEMAFEFDGRLYRIRTFDPA